MEFETLLRFAAALAAVLGLIALFAAAAKRFGLANRVRSPGGSAARRLGIVETLSLDARRQLVLVRRDGVEHLILAGAAGDIVIEANISRPEAAS
jgi:flagellar protein FliO/FliZ